MQFIWLPIEDTALTREKDELHKVRKLLNNNASGKK